MSGPTTVRYWANENPNPAPSGPPPISQMRPDPVTSERAKRRADAIEVMEHSAWLIVAYFQRVNNHEAADQLAKAIKNGEFSQ